MPRFALATLNHSTLHGLQTDWKAHLDAAADSGFDALAPDIFWLRALLEEGMSLQSLRKELVQRELACLEIAGIAIAEPEATKAELVENLRYAEALGAEFINARIVAPMSTEIVESVVLCAEAFWKVGTKVALEFSRGTTLQGVADAQRLIEAAGCDGVGVTLDTWHFFLAEEGPDWDALTELPFEFFANVQLSDGVPYPEGAFQKATMNERRLPGEGEFDFARIAETLAAKGFDQDGQGAIILEILNAEWRSRSLQEFASAAIDASRRALNKA